MATVVDHDNSPTDPIAVDYAVATRCQGDRDLIIIPNVKGSSLDLSSDQENFLTTKMGVGATATILKSKERLRSLKIPGEEKVNHSDYFQIRTRD